jgi:hypothetical protein
MKTKRSFSLTLTVGVAVAAVILTTAAALGAPRGPDGPKVEPAQSAQTVLVSLESTYAGWVELSWAVPGVYSDTLTPPSGTLPELGSIDLGLLLHRDEDNLAGYVDLDNTLVFTGEHVITSTQAITTPLAVGPWVQGTFDGAALQLESERFSMVTDAGQPVMRQFCLSGTRASPTTFTGEYRETLWGYGPQPLTIVGEFTLQLLSGENMVLSHQIYLPVMLKNH